MPAREAASLPRTILVSALSGCAWGAIARFLARGVPGVEGAVLASPLIGVLVGITIRGLRYRYALRRGFVALLALYLGVALFGLAVGISDLASNPNSGPGWHRNQGAVLLQGIIGCVWGVTFAGWVLVLWPLAYGNVLLLEKRPTGR